MNWHQACELPYYHGSDLGANPTAEDTTFKLWAPTACGVVVCLFATGTDDEPGAKRWAYTRCAAATPGVGYHTAGQSARRLLHLPHLFSGWPHA